MIIFQATIGIDFLSKTMYLEDRTVRYVFIMSHYSSKKCSSICFLCRCHHVFPFYHFTLCFYITLEFSFRFVNDTMFLDPTIISIFCFPSIPWLGHEILPLPVPHVDFWLATDSAATLGYSRTGTFPQPHPQLHPWLSRCCGGLWYSQ